MKAGGEGDDRGWDGWMASPTQWTWVWIDSGSWWWTGRPGVLQSMRSQRVRHKWATELTDWDGESLKNSEQRSDMINIILRDQSGYCVEANLRGLKFEASSGAVAIIQKRNSSGWYQRWSIGCDEVSLILGIYWRLSHNLLKDLHHKWYERKRKEVTPRILDWETSTFEIGGAYSSVGKESACSAGDPGLIPGLGRSPGEGNEKPTAVVLPGESHGQRSLAGYCPWHCKSWHDLVTISPP